MTHRRFRKRLGRFAKLASLVAALGLVAAPLALAGTETGSEHTPEAVPPAYNGSENPGAEYTPEGVPLGPPAETPPPGVPVGPEGTAPPVGVIPGPPAGVEPGSPEGLAPSFNGTENPGESHRSAAEARALGREECQEFKKNFGDNKSQFGKCVAAVARALHGSAAPVQACAGMNRKPEAGERRSDFSACVAAAAQALREGH
jgi:hypothetical protein